MSSADTSNPPAVYVPYAQCFVVCTGCRICAVPFGNQSQIFPVRTLIHAADSCTTCHWEFAGIRLGRQVPDSHRPIDSCRRDSCAVRAKAYTNTVLREGS